MKRNRAAVVVLGDIGRSPRMQYHALSLARQVSYSYYYYYYKLQLQYFIFFINQYRHFNIENPN